MIRFDDLPRTNRALLLARLDMEIAEANCMNIFGLARKRQQTIDETWREICRKAGQPRCAIPAALVAPRDQWSESVAAAHSDSTTAPPPIESSTATPTATSSPEDADVNAGSGHRALNLRVPLVAGAVAVLALGGGLVVLVASLNSTVAPQISLQIPNASPGNIIRDGSSTSNGQTDRTAGRTPPGGKPEFDPNSIPPPTGTIRRLEAISKSFKK